ncbi:MAG: alpha/beta fold hydrolase [Patescibacteria group bacterium]
MKDIDLQVDGLQLKAELFAPNVAKGKRPGVLLIHGWESAQDRMFGLAEELTELGYVCLTIDLRGHGKSEGDHKVYSRKEFLADVAAAYDFLSAQEQVDPGRIVSIGSSFGGYLSALLSAQRKLSGMVLRVPADYRDTGFDAPQYSQRKESDHSEWKSRLHAHDETAALRAVHSFKGSILVIESEYDELVPKTTVESYRDAVSDKSKVTYVVMKGAPHSISKYPEFQREFAKIVISWLGEAK